MFSKYSERLKHGAFFFAKIAMPLVGDGWCLPTFFTKYFKEELGNDSMGNRYSDPGRRYGEHG